MLWALWIILGVASAILFSTKLLIVMTIMMNVIAGSFVWWQVIHPAEGSVKMFGGALLRVGAPLFLPMWTAWFIKFSIIKWG
jgi:hypothetical protein